MRIGWWRYRGLSASSLILFVAPLRRHIRKPPLDEEEAKKQLLQEIPHVWLWSDSFFFLDKKKGDPKDHSLLLVG